MIGLSSYEVTAAIAVSDMDWAREFYEGKLGLSDGKESSDGGRTYQCGGRTAIHVYPRPTTPERRGRPWPAGRWMTSKRSSMSSPRGASPSSSTTSRRSSPMNEASPRLPTARLPTSKIPTVIPSLSAFRCRPGPWLPRTVIVAAGRGLPLQVNSGVAVAAADPA